VVSLSRPPRPTRLVGGGAVEQRDEWIAAERRYHLSVAIALTRRLVESAAPEVVHVAA